MTDEQFDQQDVLAQEQELDKARAEELAEIGALQDEPEGGEPSEQASEEGQSAQEDDTGSQKQEPFRFSDEHKEDDQQQGDEETFEIVHNGQVHRLTKDRIKNLAQKGFDYDHKVGPHARIAQILEQDQGAAQVLDTYLKQRMGQSSQQEQPQNQNPLSDWKPKPADQFNSDEEWMQANVADAVQTALQQQQQSWQQQMQQYQSQQQQQSGPALVQQALMTHDPQGYREVAPHLKDLAARSLTMEQYQRVNNDLSALIEFYDWAKTQLNPRQEQQSQPQAQKRQNKPSFRAQSRGGEASRPSEQQAVWEMPRDEFQKVMSQLQGYQ